nr:glycosyltransferase family 4 protein [Thermomonas mangrovi]
MLLAGFAASVVRFRGDLIRAMQACGCEVHVAAPGLSACREVAEALSRMGVRMHDTPLGRTGTSIPADLAYLFRSWRLMRRVRPAATLAYTAKPVIYGTLAAWVAGVPYRYALVTGLGFAFTAGRRGMLTQVVAFLYRIALVRARLVFFQNPDDQRLFRARGLLLSSTPSVVVDGSGVDVASYAATPLPTGSPVFLMIGRLIGDKGVREYAEAARCVKLRFPAARFRLAGWIDANPDAIAPEELDAWVADGTIEFLGRLEDVRPAIAAATAYVLPSYREGTPRTVLEAMAMGRPIITTDAPGCRETVIDGENGFLVPVGSVDALVESMVKFIGDPALAPRMGERSRGIAEEKYDVHKVNAVMLREMGIAPPQSGAPHAG